MSRSISKGFSATVRAVNGNKKFVSKRSAIILTESAVNRIKQLIEGKPEVVSLRLNDFYYKKILLKIGLRIGVKQRGCNGLSYFLDYAKQKEKFDEEVVQDGVRVFIDSKAQLSLLGTEMDFVETKLSSEFVFNNPNVKGMCGCGESFTL